MTHDPDKKTSVGDDFKLAGVTLGKGAISFIPVVGGFVVELVNGAQERQRRREEAVVAETLARLQIGIDEIGAKLNQDEALADLWERAIKASGATRLESKRRVFASIMARSVGADDTERAATSVLIRILDQLEEEHLHVMAVVSRYSGSVRLDQEGQGVDRAELVCELAHLGDFLDVLVASLLSLNVIKNIWRNTWNGIEGKERFALTQTGQILCEHLMSDDE